jgi:flagellar FliL protein
MEIISLIDEPAPPPQKTGPSLMIQALVLLALTAAAAGGGWVTGSLLDGAKTVAESPEAQASAEPQEKEAADKPAEPLRLLELKTITTNLADPQEIWVRLELALAFNDTPDPQTAELVHQDLLAYLRTVKSRQIEGASGFQHLKSDLDERARIRSAGKVEQVLVRTLLFE